MNAQEYVVFDLKSGTYFCAADAVLIHWDKLTEEQQDTMINGSDTERCLLADDVSFPWFWY